MRRLLFREEHDTQGEVGHGEEIWASEMLMA